MKNRLLYAIVALVLNSVAHGSQNLKTCFTISVNATKSCVSVPTQVFESFRPSYQEPEQDGWGDTPLHRAVESGDRSSIETLLLKDNAPCGASNLLDETPFSLMMKKYNALWPTFKSCGCVYVEDLGSLKYLLDNNGHNFNDMLSLALKNDKEPNNTMITLRDIFQAADTISQRTAPGDIFAHPDGRNKGHFFMMMTIADLQKTFPTLEIVSFRNKIVGYFAARSLASECKLGNYTKAKDILNEHSWLAHDTNFCKYILSQFLTIHEPNCWNLLVEYNFKSTDHPAFGTILHALASNLNGVGLKALMLTGADIHAKNEQGQTPVDIIAKVAEKDKATLLAMYGMVKSGLDEKKINGNSLDQHNDNALWASLNAAIKCLL